MHSLKMDVRLKTPWTMMICGPSSCGKTVFVKNFLKHIDSMCDVHFDRIMMYYSEWQPTYLEFGDNIEFHEGLPKVEDYVSDPRPKLMILDDWMHEAGKLFTK